MGAFQVLPAIARGVKKIVLGGAGRRASLMLGRLGEFGPQREVWLDLDREHVIAVVGKRGSGKTHTLGVLVEGLVTALGSGNESSEEKRHAVVVFDTLNLFQWIDLPLAEAQGAEAEKQRQLLKAWKLEAASISPTYWHPVGSPPASSSSREFSINPGDLDAQDWGRLLGLDIATEPMGQLLSEIYAEFDMRRRKAGARQLHAAEEMLTILRSSEQLSEVAPLTAACTASATRRAARKSAATSPTSR